MKRISLKMKLLSLAILGLGGMAVAGSAAAACPTSPSPPWSGTIAVGGGAAVISNTGLDGSDCKLDTRLGSSTASQASVFDQSPANEPRYRVQFLVNADALGTLGNQDSVSLFAANSQNVYPATGGTKKILQVGLIPAAGGAKRLAFVYACDNGTTNSCLAVSTANLTAGVNRIEMDMSVGATGSLRYWINAASGSAEPAATGEVMNINNAGWVGVDIAALGLGSASPSFVTNHSAQIVSFDTFDSRRQTYIGH